MNNIGTRIYGYCNGYFGRDDYNNKIIILEGPTWIVYTYTKRDVVTVANFDSIEEKIDCIKRWSVDEDGYGEDDE